MPSLLDKLHKLDSKLIYNPEFLREKHANLDFMNSEMIIFGGDRNISSKFQNILADIQDAKQKRYIFTDLKDSIINKYSINTF